MGRVCSQKSQSLLPNAVNYMTGPFCWAVGTVGVAVKIRGHALREGIDEALCVDGGAAVIEIDA